MIALNNDDQRATRRRLDFLNCIHQESIEVTHLRDISFFKIFQTNYCGKTISTIRDETDIEVHGFSICPKYEGRMGCRNMGKHK